MTIDDAVMSTDADVNIAGLPPDRSRQRGPGTRATHAFQLPADVSTPLLELTGRQDTALRDLAVATVLIVLSRYTGMADLAVATALPAPEGGTSLVPLRARVSDETPF